MAKSPERYAVALGMFDGVHIGHQKLLAYTARLARERGWTSMAYTFSNHPRELFGGAPARLMTQDEREKAMKSLGIQRVEMTPFDKAMAEMTPEEFLSALTSKFNIAAVVVGFNYTFGCRCSGTPDTLRELGPRFGFETHVIAPVVFGGEPVSSTRIRRLINQDEKLARTLLGK